MTELRLNAAVVVGVFIATVAMSVIFSQTIFPAVAAVAGLTLIEAALGWLILGATVVLAGLARQVSLDAD